MSVHTVTHASVKSGFRERAGKALAGLEFVWR